MKKIIKKLPKAPLLLKRRVTPLRLPPRLEGKVKNRGIKPTKK